MIDSIISPGASAVRLTPTMNSPTGSVRRPLDADEVDLGVEGGEHRQPVAGRRAGGEVAADRAGIADLRAADRARRLGQRRQHRRNGSRSISDHVTAAPNVTVRAAGSNVHVDSSGTRVKRDHVGVAVGPGKAAMALVDLDQQVGAARQQRRRGVGGELGDGLVEAAGNEHGHGPRLYSTRSPDSASSALRLKRDVEGSML